MSCKFISSEILVYYTYVMHILQHFMQLPISCITCISSFMQDESWRSYLCGAVTVMTLICLFRNANFLTCLRPVLDSFLLMLFAPPQMITKSSRCSWLISLRTERVICSGLEPGITALITSKVLPSEFESSAA